MHLLLALHAWGARKARAQSIAPAIWLRNRKIVLAPTILLYNRLRLGLNAGHAALATHNACATFG